MKKYSIKTGLLFFLWVSISCNVFSQTLTRFLPLDTASCSPSIILNAGNSGASYFWSSGETTQTITVTGNGNLGLTVSNTNSTISSSCSVTLFQSPVVTLNDTTVCDGVQTIVSRGLGSRFNWYSSSTALQPVFSGSSFSSSFSSASTYWVQALNLKPIGSVGEVTNVSKPKLSFNGNRGIQFDCSTNIIIDTVYVYAVSVPATITVELYQNSTRLTSKTFTVTSVGKFPLPLNFEVQPGSNYNLIKTNGGSNFYLGDNSTYSYPYKISNKISLKNYSNGLSTFLTTYYGYFYDWKISEVVCKSAKQPIIINVRTSPVAENPSDTTVCNLNLAILQANRVPNSQNTYSWSTGATTNSVSISNNGVYQVTISNGICSTSKGTNVQMYSPVQILSTLDTAICSGLNTITVVSNKKAYWYKNNALESFNVGNSYSALFNVGTDSSWVSFVDAISLGGVGEQTNRNALSFSAAKGTNFDVLANLTLDSISVYAVNNNSTIEIELYKDNTLLKSKVFLIPNNGLNRLSLNWDIPIGSNYKLMKKLDANLFNLGNNGITYTYPYQISNVIRLNAYQNSLSAVTTDYYSYFFDWRIIQKKCQSPKQLFKVNVLATPTPPLTDTITCGNYNIALNAQNQGGTYLWSNGQTTQNITASTSGTYKVTITNGGVCSVKDSAQVQIYARPAVPVASTVTLCSPQATSYYTPIPNQVYTWYATTSGGSPYFIGSPYNPSINRDTTFYVEASALATGRTGELSRPTNSTVTSSFSIGTRFNVIRPIIFDSVAFYATQVPCQFSINIMNASGGIIASVPVNLTVADKKTFVKLPQIPLSVANNYTISISNLTSGKLGISSTTYPLNTSHVQITGNSVGGNGYYYFYDWNYSFPVDFCSSSRVSLPIEVVLPLNLPDTLKNCNAVSIQSPANLGTYRWNNGATTNNITTLNSGLYTLTITGSNCTATDSVRVIIPERLRFPAGNPLCGRTLSSNYANSSSTYNWSNGRTTASITITATGTYRLTVNEPSGCVLIDSLQVTRFGTVPTITLPGTPAYCNQAVLNAQNSGAQYLWSNGTTTQTATFASAGTARVTVTNTDQCTATSQASFTLDAQPQAAFNIQPIAGNPLRYQFVNSSTGNTANQWDFGFITSQAQSPTVNFPAAGRYVVSLVVTNSCGSSTLTNSVDLPLANEYTLNSEFNLRPNPNNGTFLIELPESLNTEIIIVNLYNLYGQQLHQQKWQANNRKQLDMQTVLSSGVYYINITHDNNNQVWYTRFVVD